MQINKDRDWEALYQANDTFWDHGEASPGLVDYL
ncbi:MAG: thiopurine S-methyltransferase, partial [Verrucomicrobia bacterium]|nr:thiopurine S-methyltransferase [Verrucomicrobiota bacterium]